LIYQEAKQLSKFSAPTIVEEVKDSQRATEFIKNSNLHGKLIVEKGAQVGQEFSLEKIEDVYIGNRRDCGIRIKDKHLSNVHARIVVENGKAKIADMNSANGTELNGNLLKPQELVLLNDDDTIKIGETVLRYQKLAEISEIFQRPSTTVMPSSLLGRLKIEAGENVGTEYDVRHGITIGKNEGNDIQLSDEFVSDNHAKITIAEGIVYITDLNSTNGTKVNGRLIPSNQPYELASGDTITFGNETLQLELFDNAQAAEMAGVTKYDIRRVLGKVQIVSGTGAGWEYDVRPGTIIGRRGNCEIKMDNPLVSEQHAKFQPENGKVLLIDLDSKNGTRVNKKTISKKAIYNGDIIEIGDSILVFSGSRKPTKIWLPIAIGILIIGFAAISILFYIRNKHRNELFNEHLRVANIFIHDKLYSQALAEYNNALKLNPKRTEINELIEETQRRKSVHGNLDKAYESMKLGMYNDAMRYCDQILYNLDLGNSEARNIKMEAIKLMDIDRENTDLMREMEKEIMRGNYLAAINIGEVILNKQPDNEAVANLKEQAEEKRKVELASKRQARLQEIKQLEKNMKMEYSIGALPLAERDARKILDLDPNNSEASKYLSMIYGKIQEEKKTGIAATSKITERIPQEDSNNIQRARELYKQALKVELDHLDYGKDIRPAISMWQQIISLVPDQNNPLNREARKKLAKYGEKY
jgi:pSer/pThr/pTyr-binding forkhead associated (FHA) protein/tetratricopeptide (TPR) repeat protein